MIEIVLAIPYSGLRQRSAIVTFRDNARERNTLAERGGGGEADRGREGERERGRERERAEGSKKEPETDHGDCYRRGLRIQKR